MSPIENIVRWHIKTHFSIILNANELNTLLWLRQIQFKKLSFISDTLKTENWMTEGNITLKY